MAETHTCGLCGNEIAFPNDSYPVLMGDDCALVCSRCSGVVVDRTRNLALGEPLLTRRKIEATIWKVPVS